MRLDNSTIKMLGIAKQAHNIGERVEIPAVKISPGKPILRKQEVTTWQKTESLTTQITRQVKK